MGQLGPLEHAHHPPFNYHFTVISATVSLLHHVKFLMHILRHSCAVSAIVKGSFKHVMFSDSSTMTE
jgi:hypothetical protein